MKITALIAAVCMMGMLFAGCDLTDESAVATVNGEKIAKSEFALYFNSIQGTMLSEAGVNTQDAAAINAFWANTEIDGKKAADVARERALEEAVKIVVKTQKAKEMGVALTSSEKSELNRQIGSMVTQLGGKANYEKYLKTLGMTDASYKKYMEQNTLAYKLDQQLAADPAYAPTDEELTQAAKAALRAKHILIATKDVNTGASYDEAQKADAKKRAEDILSRVKAGENFDTLMAELSEDPGSKSNPDGYEFTEGEMVTEFYEAAKALPIGGVSGLVESDFGYHIIKRLSIELTEEKIAQFKETQKSVQASKKIEAKVEEWRNDPATVVEVDEKALAEMEIAVEAQ